MRPYYYLGQCRALTQLANGLPFFLNTRDRGIATWIILGGTWENFVDDVLCDVTRAGDRVLDAGANQGYYSVKLGHIVGPRGHVTAFEPNPELYELLESNLDINGFTPRSTVHRQALGEAAGTAQLRFTYENMGGGSLAADLARGGETVDVEVVRGDDALPPGAAFEVMKFDIEGFEPIAVKGLAATIARSPQAAIVLEISPRAWRRDEPFGAILARFLGKRLAFEICHDGLLEPLAPSDPRALAVMAARDDAFYALLIPGHHWAIDKVRARLRPKDSARA